MQYNEVELFIAGLDEKCFDEIIELYEKGDHSGLDNYLDKLPGPVPKQALLENLAILKELKDMTEEH